MRSTFAAFLKWLVLPAGRTSGPRIVLDGVNGRIDIYDATNKRIATLNAQPESGLLILPDTGAGDGDETISLETDATTNHAALFLGKEGTSPIDTAGRIDLFELGTYSVAVRFAAPVDDPAGDQAQFLMASEDVSVGLPPIWWFRDQAGPTDIVQIYGGTPPDIKFNGRSMSRHIMPNVFRDTADSAALGDLATPDFAVSNLSVEAGQTYKVCCSTNAFASAASVWRFGVLHDGNPIGQFQSHRFDAVGAGNDQDMGGAFLWTPATDSDADLTTIVDRTAGAGTLTFTGLGGTGERQMWVEHLGEE